MTDPIPSEIRCSWCNKEGRIQLGGLVHATIADYMACGRIFKPIPSVSPASTKEEK